MRRSLFVASLIAILTVAACNSVPVSGLEKSFSLVVDQTQGTGDPVKIDFLWVVDNSSSMCEEQVALAQNFETFTSQLVEQFELDAQVAVTTMDMLCDPQNPDVVASKGQFSRQPATGFPPGCQKKVRQPCTGVDTTLLESTRG